MWSGKERCSGRFVIWGLTRKDRASLAGHTVVGKVDQSGFVDVTDTEGESPVQGRESGRLGDERRVLDYVVQHITRRLSRSRGETSVAIQYQAMGSVDCHVCVELV